MKQKLLFQLLLPLVDDEGKVLPADVFGQVEEELIERYGGLTAYSRSPARGLWTDREQDETVTDKIVVYEVMNEKKEREFWKVYKSRLEHLFRQKEIVIRCSPIETF